MSRQLGHQGPDMRSREGRAGLRQRQAGTGMGVIEWHMRFDGLGGDGSGHVPEQPRDWEAYDRSKADPYDEAWGLDR